MKLHTLINHYAGSNVTFSKYRCENVAYEPVITSQILKVLHDQAFILALTKDSSLYDRCVIYRLPQRKIENYTGWIYSDYMHGLVRVLSAADTKTLLAWDSAPILDSPNTGL